MQQNHIAAAHLDLPIHRGDNTGGYRAVEPQRIADGNGGFSHFHLAGIAELGGRQVLSVNFQHGNIAFHIGADELGRVSFSIVQCDGNAVAPFHHMVIGDDIAVLRQNDPRTGAAGGIGLETFGDDPHH